MLAEYRNFLGGFLRENTARAYGGRLAWLLDSENINTKDIFDKLEKLKYQNEFSQSKNAFLYFLKFKHINLSKKELEQLQELSNNKIKKYRKMSFSNFQKIDQTIKHLKNEKLKLSYQTMIETGLRVFEVSQLTKENTMIDKEMLFFTFTGKGGKEQQVTIGKNDNPLLFKRLVKLIEHTKDNHKIFYSMGYLQSNAKRLGFQCHDLRRATAKLEFEKTKSKEEVKKKLRHSNMDTTEIYLNSKIKV